jgi:molecular chaperone HtpG
MDNSTRTKIGKDVIESLTMGMYDDSKFIFREYIQNSADQIDKGIAQKLLSIDEGEIFIFIDEEKKQISIEDNATGIESKQVRSILSNIAQSTKVRGVHKGFRGIGRLGGLGYCDTLTFETSFKGEGIKTTMKWDACQLKQIINNRTNKEEASDVIDRVISITEDAEDPNKHYFKVVLQNVNNPELLDVSEVRNYLAMTAPVPFSNKFIYKDEIANYLAKEGVRLDEYKIYVNTEQIVKGYSTYIYKGDDRRKEKIGEITGVEFFKERDREGNLLYIGWYSLSTALNEQMKSINRARGIRLRKANIQIGDEYALESYHREQRGNFYFLGEVHAIHSELIPNSRRDKFIENSTFYEFAQKLRNTFYPLKDLYYAASAASSAYKRIQEFENLRQDYLDKAENKGFIDKEDQKNAYELLEKRKSEALSAKKEIEKISKRYEREHAFKKVIESATQNKSEDVVTIDRPDPEKKTKFRADNLSGLSREQRKFLSKIFSIIRSILDEQTANQVIEKIEEQLK